MGWLAGLAVTPVASDTTKLDVSWTACTGAEKYLVKWKAGSGAFNDGEESTTAGHTITGLTADTAYTVEVAAIGTGAGVDVVLAKGEATSATLDAMGAISVAAVHGRAAELDVSWPVVKRATGYVVPWKPGGASAWPADNEADVMTGTTYRIRGLPARSAYDVRVTARVVIGGSAADGASAEGRGMTEAAFALIQEYLVGRPVSVTLPAATGDEPLTYSLAGHNGEPLPAGLTFDAATHTLSGTPTSPQAPVGYRAVRPSSSVRHC